MKQEKEASSKYMVYFDGTALNAKPWDNADTVFCIAQLWVILQQKIVDIDELNDIFPIKINHYYDSGKEYEHLFIQKENYMYADEAGNQQQIPATELHCDIEWSGKYDLLLTPPMTFPPKHATLLQKWNDEDTTSFIKYAMTLPEFENKLSVVKAI